MSAPLGVLDPALLPTGTAAITAMVGAFVAYQAHRGYRRNASRVMLYLAVGILLLTTVPFLIRLLLELLAVGSGAGRYLVAQVLQISGLVVVLYALAR